MKEAFRDSLLKLLPSGNGDPSASMLSLASVTGTLDSVGASGMGGWGSLGGWGWGWDD